LRLPLLKQDVEFYVANQRRMRKVPEASRSETTTHPTAYTTTYTIDQTPTPPPSQMHYDLYSREVGVFHQYLDHYKMDQAAVQVERHALTGQVTKNGESKRSISQPTQPAPAVASQPSSMPLRMIYYDHLTVLEQLLTHVWYLYLSRYRPTAPSRPTSTKPTSTIHFATTTNKLEKEERTKTYHITHCFEAAHSWLQGLLGEQERKRSSKIVSRRKDATTGVSVSCR